MKKIFIENGFITSCGTGISGQDVSDDEFDSIANQLLNVPKSPEGYTYRLRADNLEWELVELPPAPEYEPTIEDKAKAYDILIGDVSDA